jgi:hypothetical protein
MKRIFSKWHCRAKIAVASQNGKQKRFIFSKICFSDYLTYLRIARSDVLPLKRHREP